METNLLDRMLSTYLAERTILAITLQNKTRITGKIKAFDSYIIVLDGAKREILYRHAICGITPNMQSEPKQAHAPARPAPAVKSEQPKPSANKSRPQQHPAAAPSDQSVTNTMKEGLLRWMQEHKAAK